MATLTQEQVARLLLNAGLSPAAAARLTAIAGLESGLRTDALNTKAPDYSVGLFQTNYYGSLYDSRTKQFGAPASLLADPAKQAYSARIISRDGTYFAPWTTNNQVTPARLASAQAAVQRALGQSTSTITPPPYYVAAPGQPSQPAPGTADVTSAQTIAASRPASSNVSLNILRAIDDALNDTGSALNPLKAGANYAQIYIARGGTVVLGSILAVFGLLLVVQSVGSKTGADKVAAAIPGPTGVIAGAVDKVA